MRKENSSHKIWFTAFLLLVFGAGCGDPDKTGNPGTTPPTVITVAPSDGVCPDTTVTATFSEDMNPATIDTTTFTLTGPGGAVAGAVSYDVPSRVATFTPPVLLSHRIPHTPRPLPRGPWISLAFHWQLTLYGPSPHLPTHVQAAYRWERPAVSEFWPAPRSPTPDRPTLLGMLTCRQGLRSLDLITREDREQ